MHPHTSPDSMIPFNEYLSLKTQQYPGIEKQSPKFGKYFGIILGYLGIFNLSYDEDGRINIGRSGGLCLLYPFPRASISSPSPEKSRDYEIALW